MSELIYELQLDETNRVAIYTEDYGYTPEDILGDDGESGWFFMPKRGYYGALEYYVSNECSGGELTQELVSLAKQLQDFKDYDELKADLLTHVTRNGYKAKGYELYGNSQGDYLEVICYGQGDYIDSMADTLGKWFRGEIYTAAHETLEVYTNFSNGNLIERCEAQDSIGCMVLESGDEAELKEIARLHFGIKEKAAA